MEKFKLSKDVYVKTVAINVKDVDKMVNFYKNVLGFVLKLEENNLSIFGSQEKNSRLLILEEIDSEENQVETVEQSICLSLLIPSEEEFGSLLRRISVHNYPINKSEKQGQRKSVYLKDPEGNDLEVRYQGATDQSAGDIEALDTEYLIQQSNILYSSLSEDVRFSQIKLSVQNKSKHRSFYKDILGMSSENMLEDKLYMNDGNFSVYLNDKIEQNEKKVKGDKFLGLDFFVLALEDEEEMKKMKRHLENKQQEFFVDKKLTILTIYDPSKIEWWFVRG